MMSNLSSIYNTISRQAESLGKPAAVHTLHGVKSMPLKKETPEHLAICPAAPWTVKYLHFPAFPCLVPPQPSPMLCHPWLGMSCENPHTFASWCYHNPRNPTGGSLESWNAPLTPVLRVPQRGSHTCAARILIPEHKTPSHTGTNNFRPAGRQLESMAAAANYGQAQVFHLEEQVRTRFLFQIHSYCTLEEVLTPPPFLPGVLQNTCNFMRLNFYQASLQWWQGAFILPEMQREVRNHRDTNLMAQMLS